MGRNPCSFQYILWSGLLGIWAYGLRGADGASLLLCRSPLALLTATGAEAC